MIHIYYLIDPRNDVVRYVGATNNPTQREFNRLCGRSTEGRVVEEWLEEIVQPPIMRVVCIVEKVEGSRTETLLKRRLVTKGVPLLNDASKKWSFRHSEESRRKISEAKKEYWANRRKE